MGPRPRASETKFSEEVLESHVQQDDVSLSTLSIRHCIGNGYDGNLGLRPMHGSATITTTPDPMARSGYVEAVIATYLWVPARRPEPTRTSAGWLSRSSSASSPSTQPSPPSCSGRPDVPSTLPTLNRLPGPRTPLLHDRPGGASRTPSRARLRRPPTPQAHATRQDGLRASRRVSLQRKHASRVPRSLITVENHMSAMPFCYSDGASHSCSLSGRRVAKVLSASLMAASPTLRLVGG